VDEQRSSDSETPPGAEAGAAPGGAGNEPVDRGFFRDRLARGGEEALGRLAEELAGNPLVTAAVSRAFHARERAAQAQEAAMGVIGIPSTADVERLTRRLRSLSQRLEGIEDALDRLDARLASLSALDRVVDRLEANESRNPVEALGGRIDALGARIDELRAFVVPDQEPPPSSQERLTVSEG